MSGHPPPALAVCLIQRQPSVLCAQYFVWDVWEVFRNDTSLSERVAYHYRAGCFLLLWLAYIAPLGNPVLEAFQFPPPSLCINMLLRDSSLLPCGWRCQAHNTSVQATHVGVGLCVVLFGTSVGWRYNSAGSLINLLW